MAVAGARRTRGGLVYEQVRAAILCGRLRPGQRLKLAGLATEHGVSLNVVREALNRLAGEQLVRAEPQVGFAVTDLSLEDLADLVNVRIAIESSALRWSIARGDVAWESEIVAAHYRLANTAMTTEGDPLGVTDEWIRAHSEFHAVILSACDSARMQDITRSLSDAAEIYRRWSLPLAHPHRDLPGEHAEIMNATLARAADRAVAALTAHIEQTRDTLVENAGAGAATHEVFSEAPNEVVRPGRRRRE